MFNINLVAMEEVNCISIIKDIAPKSGKSPREDACICIIGSAKVVCFNTIVKEKNWKEKLSRNIMVKESD